MKKPALGTDSPAKKQTPKRRRVVIEVDAELFEEVEYLLKTPESIAAFGATGTMRQRMGRVTDSWMNNITFGLREGSGSRRACGLGVLKKGGNP